MAEKPSQPVDGLPSYSESVSSAYTPTSSLPRNINEARTTLISALVNTQITPCLHNNALAGLSNTTLLIIPANVLTLQSSQLSNGHEKSSSNTAIPGETILGFSSAESPTLIRLQSQENSLEFWSQPAVISELKQHLCSQLKIEGYQIAEDNAESILERSSGKKSGRIIQSKVSNVEWRTPQRKVLRNGEASIDVGMQDICLRIENLMGLYETRTGEGVAVKINVGG